MSRLLQASLEIAAEKGYRGCSLHTQQSKFAAMYNLCLQSGWSEAERLDDGRTKMIHLVES